MAWFADTYRILKGDHDINAMASATGKPVELSGIEGSGMANSYGVYFATSYLLSRKYYTDKLGLTTGIKGKKCIIQGYGNVGSHFANLFYKNGGIIIAICDRKGSIYDKNGIDIEALYKHRQKRGKIYDFEGPYKYYNERPLFFKTDIVVFCSSAIKVVHKNNMHMF